MLTTRDDVFRVLDNVMDPEVPVISVVELRVQRQLTLNLFSHRHGRPTGSAPKHARSCAGMELRRQDRQSREG